MNDSDILTAYLAPLREAVGEAQYELNKLLYCYHRFYGPNHLKRTMTYELARVIFQVSRLRKQVRRCSFLSDPRVAGFLPATQELVKFFSMHCGLREEDQKVFLEEIKETTSSNDEFAHRKAFDDFFQSKGKILETTIGQWIDNQMLEADKVVKPHDEHRLGECEYVEQFIASHPLYMSLDRMLGTLDAIIQQPAAMEPPSTEATLARRPSSKNSPWISGSFYLFAAVVVLAVLGVISTAIPWYALIPVIIGGLLFVTTLGAFQLRSDEGLTEKSFMSLMLETLRRIVLLKDRALPSSDTEGSQEADDMKGDAQPVATPDRVQPGASHPSARDR